MTNAVPNVSRELLERASNLAFQTQHYPLHEELRTLLSAPSPVGVDGLETIGYATESELAQLLDPTMPTGKYVRIGLDHPTCWKEDAPYEHLVALCALSGASAIIDGLRGENERIRLNIAEYNEAISCYQSERDQQAQRIGELEGLLRDSAELIKHGVFEDGICCCGSSVDSHGFGDGHSPVDALAYHAGQVCERLNAAPAAPAADAGIVERLTGLWELELARAQKAENELAHAVLTVDQLAETIANYKSQFSELHAARNLLSRLSMAGFELGDDAATSVIDERDQQAQRIGELEGLLRDIGDWVNDLPIPTRGATAKALKIDAALSAGKERL